MTIAVLVTIEIQKAMVFQAPSPVQGKEKMAVVLSQHALSPSIWSPSTICYKLYGPPGLCIAQYMVRGDYVFCNTYHPLIATVPL